MGRKINRFVSDARRALDKVSPDMDDVKRVVREASDKMEDAVDDAKQVAENLGDKESTLLVNFFIVTVVNYYISIYTVVQGF